MEYVLSQDSLLRSELCELHLLSFLSVLKFQGPLLTFHALRFLPSQLSPSRLSVPSLKSQDSPYINRERVQCALKNNNHN